MKRVRGLGHSDLEKRLGKLPQEIRDRFYTILDEALKRYCNGHHNKFDFGSEVLLAFDLAWSRGLKKPKNQGRFGNRNAAKRKR